MTSHSPTSLPEAGQASPDRGPSIEPDEDISDEAYAESTHTSYATSIASEIMRGVEEHGRLYPAYGNTEYGMPVDEREMDRMDMQHQKYYLLLNDRHYLAPILNPQRILDLGTGTGIWALAMADLFPSASVTGNDIAPIQPRWTAPNCVFEIDDAEQPWTYRPNSFDFIHSRDFLYSIRDWPRLVQQCYTALKPGGYLELTCIHPLPKCDDNSVPPDSGFPAFCAKTREAGALFGTPLDSPLHFKTWMETGGFEAVSENIFKVPSGPWPLQKRLKDIGALEMANIIEGAAAFSLRVFDKCFGWSREQTEVFLMQLRKDIRRKDYHNYCDYYVVYGRKPKTLVSETPRML